MNPGEKWPFKLNVKVKSIEVEAMFARFTPLGLFATAALQKSSRTLKMIVTNPFLHIENAMRKCLKQIIYIRYIYILYIYIFLVACHFSKTARKP